MNGFGALKMPSCEAVWPTDCQPGVFLTFKLDNPKCRLAEVGIKILVPSWILSITWHQIFRVPIQGPQLEEACKISNPKPQAQFEPARTCTHELIVSIPPPR